MIKFIKLNDQAVVPKLAHDGDAGFDLSADNSFSIDPFCREMVTTGISVEMAPGLRGEIWPRSGLAARHGIDVLGGMIDSCYRGQLIAILINHGPETFEIKPGERIAQIVFSPTITQAIEWTGTVSETDRGAGGFSFKKQKARFRVSSDRGSNGFGSSG